MTLTGEEKKTTFHLHCSQCAKPSKESHMQLVIINGGIVSTCRGCDRQTRHPHIQLQVRRQEELSSFVQTPQQAWTLSPSFFFLGSDTAHYIQVRILLIKRFFFPLAHAFI